MNMSDANVASFMHYLVDQDTGNVGHILANLSPSDKEAIQESVNAEPLEDTFLGVHLVYLTDMSATNVEEVKRIIVDVAEQRDPIAAKVGAVTDIVDEGDNFIAKAILMESDELEEVHAQILDRLDDADIQFNPGADTAFAVAISKNEDVTGSDLVGKEFSLLGLYVMNDQDEVASSLFEESFDEEAKYRVTSKHEDCADWAVIESDSGEMISCHENRTEADAELARLEKEEAKSRPEKLIRLTMPTDTKLPGSLSASDVQKALDAFCACEDAPDTDYHKGPDESLSGAEESSEETESDSTEESETSEEPESLGVNTGLVFEMEGQHLKITAETKLKAVANKALFAMLHETRKELGVEKVSFTHVNGNTFSVVEPKAESPEVAPEQETADDITVKVEVIDSREDDDSEEDTVEEVASENNMADGSIGEDPVAKGKRFAFERVSQLGAPDAEGVLIVEGMETGDRRYIRTQALGHRPLPVPFMYTNSIGYGHEGAQIIGSIMNIFRQQIGESEYAVIGEIKLDTDGDVAKEAMRYIASGHLNGVSADLSEVQGEYEETGSKIDNGYRVAISAGQIMGTTLLPFPAFKEASIWLKEDEASEDGVVASGSAFYAPELRVISEINNLQYQED